jgi:transposase, IS5 family
LQNLFWLTIYLLIAYIAASYRYFYIIFIMSNPNQLGFADGLLSARTKTSKQAQQLQQIDSLVDWQPLLQAIKVMDKTSKKTGGRPRKNPLWMIKAVFLQHLFNMSDPQLEDQLMDRLSFQQFVGINLDQDVPDFTTIWRFKQALITHKLDVKIFELISQQLANKGLLVKKGTLIDATLINSANRPLSNKKREELAQQPNSQLDSDANSTKKGGVYYYGYKGHIGMDAESKLIRKLAFTPANVHDSQLTEQLISYDEKGLFADKAYADEHLKYCAREFGWYYGILDKAKRGQKLSKSQHKRNAQCSRVRSSVEHPFAWLKSKAGYRLLRAKNLLRNQLAFIFGCIGWNLSRAVYLVNNQQTSLA